MTRYRPVFRFSAIVCLLAAALAGPIAPAAAQESAYVFHPVAVTGEYAPETDWSIFGSVGFGDLDDSGLVAFTGSASFFSRGIWAGSPGHASLVVRSGDPAPGGAALSFNQFWGGALTNASGAVAFHATYNAGGVLSGDGLWAGSAGNMGLLALSGDPAPGTAGFPYSSHNFGIASIDDFGVTSFNAGFDTPSGQRTGAWTGTPGALAPVALSGDPAPDTNGLFFTHIYMVPNKAGTAIIAAKTDDPAAAFPGGYWKTGTAGLSAVAQAGDEAPGTGGRTFGNLTMGASSASGSGSTDTPSVAVITGPVLNQSGNVAFNGYLNPLDPTTGIGDEGIWIQDDTGLHLAALVGDTAPGTGGLQFADFNHVNYNILGQIAFDAALNAADPGSDRGIWRGVPGSLSLLVREGDHAPGTAGETFGTLTLGPSMNDAGDIVFYAQLAESRSIGVWAVSAEGILTPILREGDSLTVKSGDVRSVQSITYIDGFPSSYSALHLFNEAGQLAILVGFTDGTNGIFLASPPPDTPNLPPVANAGPDLTVNNTQFVTLDGTGSYDPEGKPLDYVWTIDGMLFAGGPTVTQAPFPAGTFTITLTVTDFYGATASDSMILTVTNDPPVANAGLDQTVQTLETATLDGTGSTDPEGGPIDYAWSLGGVLMATGPAPVVGPFDAGVHTITLTVTDVDGASATDEVVVTVLNRAPVANAGPDRTVNHAQAIALDGTGSSDPEGGALGYAWSIGGVQIATGATPTVGPFAVGTYTVTLTVTDDKGATTTDSMIVTVINQAPVANAGLDQTVNHAQTVALDGAGSSDPEDGALAYAWSAGGVQIATGANPVVGPFAVGVHAITLTVTDDHGATAADSMVITVTNEAPLADAGLDQTVNHAQTVTLEGVGSSDPEGGVLTFAWSLGGVQVATGANPVVGPFAVGVHTITLTVTDDKGATGTDSMIVTVTNAPPLANAGPDQTASHAQTVTLPGSGSDPEGGALSYTWNLGGVQIATGPNPTVGPFAVGTHMVTLTVTDDHGATATDSMLITVVNEAPVANAGPDQTVSVRRRTTAVTLDGSASSDPEGGVLSYLWTKDGQTVGTGATARVDLAAGVHTFILTVTDDHGAAVSDSVVVTVSKRRWGS